MRPLLVGELNPYGADPEYALFPFPRGASGNRLRQILGMTDREYLEAFDRANLCDVKWDVRIARRRIRELLSEGHPFYILLGRRVSDAFGFVGWFPLTTAKLSGLPTVLFFPHPSGRCRAWNDPENVRRARELIREVLKA